MILKNSRYAKSKVYKLGDKYHIGSREIVKFKNRYDNIIHIVIGEERLDNIAHKYWKRQDLWWLIADWNDIIDPTNSLESGTQLIIPSFQFIIEEKL